jgi:hypothetical protein
MTTPFEYAALPRSEEQTFDLQEFALDPSEDGWIKARRTLQRLYGFTPADFEFSFAEDLLHTTVGPTQVVIGRLTPGKGTSREEMVREAAPALRPGEKHADSRITALIRYFKRGEKVFRSADVWPDFGLVVLST